VFVLNKCQFMVKLVLSHLLINVNIYDKFNKNIKIYYILKVRSKGLKTALIMTDATAPQ